MRRALLVVLAACGEDGDRSSCPDKGICVSDAAMTDALFTGNPLIGIGTVETVQAGYQFVEGPQWREAEGDLLFSDIPANTIYRYVPGGAPTAFRTPSGNSNGLAIDGNGDLLAAQHGTRSVTRNGTDIVSTYNGNKLNSPNDLIATPKGIYFTDPPYGLEGRQREIDFHGVYFLAADGTLTAEYEGGLMTRPNGIALSPDGASIYVTDTADGKVWRYTVGADGHLGNRTQLIDTMGNPDGLAVDVAGNLFVTSIVGIEVFAPDGTPWGTIDVALQPANCAFGDSDHMTLYITARSTLYKVRLANPGLPEH